MSLLGIHLQLFIGPTVPTPVPVQVIDALESVEVAQTDEGRSGFQLTFRTGRGPLNILDHPLLQQGLVKVDMRVIVVVAYGTMPYVLSDGIITHQQLLPGTTSGESRLVVTGEDVSLAMDREEKIVEHPAQPELAIVPKIVASYAQYGLVPTVIPPTVNEPPLPTERIPVQRDTDLGYLKYIASRYGYVFYVEPGLAPGSNIAYWGPPKRIGVPQPALSVDMGASTNVEEMHFSYDSQRPVQVAGRVQDRTTDAQAPSQSLASTRIPLAASQPVASSMRTVLMPPTSGLSTQLSMGIAQGIMDASYDQVVVARGKVDTLVYGGVLKPRGLVGVRGAGFEYSGAYYVKSVTHHIQQDRYAQSFELTREGPGSILPVMPV